MHTLSSILAMARAGSPARAWELFVREGLADITDDPRVLTLKGRLIKDQARAASDPNRSRLFAESAAAYVASSAIKPSTYSLINAASLSLMAGDSNKSRQLAFEVLQMLDTNPDEAETPYWLGATRSEAHLLLGEPADAQRALAKAIGKASEAYEDHAATIGQFRLVADKLGMDISWLESYLPPASLHFQGVMRFAQASETDLRGQIDVWLAKHNVGFGFGALAAGADILVAEALLARGAELHILLPCDADNFRVHSVMPFGDEWNARFDHLISAADSVDSLSSSSFPGEEAVKICEAVCMGLARQNARKLQSHAMVLRLDRRHEKRACQRLSDWISSGGEAGTILVNHPEDMSGDEITSQNNLGALLAFSGDCEGDSADVAGLVGEFKVGGITIWQFMSIGAAWNAADELMKTERKLAIDHGVIDTSVESSIVFARCHALCTIAQHGQMLASKAAAFERLAGDTTLRVEEAGEIRANVGSFPAYAIISSN